MASDVRRLGRLDQPREIRRTLVPRPHYDPEAFGRLSERIARVIGTGRFIVWMTGVIVAWIAWNTVSPGPWHFDSYPFIFLTLALSLQASYAAPLILLAQNRQADRDRVQYEQDRRRSDQGQADTEYITREIAAVRIALGEVATRDFVRSELQRIADELSSDGERAALGARSEGRGGRHRP
ncbi:MAG: DUF1003 domain-containing protein [Streptosporangiaceae bacterium]